MPPDQESFTHRLYEGNPDDVIEDVVSGRAAVGIFHFDRKRRERSRIFWPPRTWFTGIWPM